MSFSAEKQLAAITMLDAYAASNRAYYYDSSDSNLRAMHACKDAIERMLEPYYRQPDTHKEIT